MKKDWLAAVAAAALMASGALAQAQESPRKDEKPSAEKSEPRAAPKEGAKSVQSEEQSNAPTKPGAEATTPKRVTETNSAREKKPVERARNGAERPEPSSGAQTGAADKQQEPRTGAAETRGQPKVVGKVQTSPENATRVTDILMSKSRSEKVDIEINVGTRVPENVTIYPLPREVLAIAPEYEGDEYFIANDEVVFVAPDSHEIVGAIEYDGRAAAVDDNPRMAGARPCPVEN